MPKKIIKILSFVVILFLIILGAVFFLVRTTPSPNESAFTKKVREIFPFGQPVRNPDDLFPGEVLNNENNTNSNSTTTTTVVPLLRKIYEFPTSGSYMYSLTDNKKQSQNFIRFVDRATGHVLEATPYRLGITKISNTTITKNYESIFANENAFLGRFLDNTNDELIKTYSILLKDKVKPATTSTSTNTINQTPKESQGTYLDENIKEITTSPKGDKIAYLIYENDGGSIIVANTNGTNKRKIYTSPLREWLITWVKEDSILLTTKPSGIAFGFTYNLNPITGGVSKVFGNVAGLTLLSNKNQTDFLIGQGGNSLSLFSLKKTSGVDQITLLTKTIPEKCVWSKQEPSIIYCAVPANIPNGIYPDYWYQGRISFNDTIWKINTTTATTNIISAPARDVGENIDVTNIQIAPDDSYLTFINKKDLSFWGLILKPEEQKTSASTTPANKISE